ncbi:AAA family ATPase [Fulvimonas soli]|uniref:AAA domain-containing protein n=1 Tax=Fulvimonas soli TaxID=155197 RepID=A0A316IHL9_9GAMM|nr:AAA family ATPase [Fulvimonas soli]PWK92360.1 AAA domain-containing protein [Fulvimonas soli]
MSALLIVLAGLPGGGKTTLARALAARLGATHLRIDTIEQTLRRAGLAPECEG